MTTNDIVPFPATGNGPLTMSSRDIAELTEKRHDNVLRDIKAMLLGLYGQDGDRFEDLLTDASELRDQVISITCEKDARGYVSAIHLDKEHTITLVAGYDVRLRKRIVDRWLELEARPVAATDPIAILNNPAAMRGLLLTYSEKVLALEAKVAEQQEDVAALDRIATADGSLCVTDAAKALQVRPKDLFDYLRSHGWIYRRAGTAHDIGYQSRVNAGDLEHKVTTVLRADGTEKVVEQVRVTPRGLAKLAKLMSPATAEVA